VKAPSLIAMGMRNLSITWRRKAEYTAEPATADLSQLKTKWNPQVKLFARVFPYF